MDRDDTYLTPSIIAQWICFGYCYFVDANKDNFYEKISLIDGMCVAVRRSLFTPLRF